jgi:hypothetical protein
MGFTVLPFVGVVIGGGTITGATGCDIPVDCRRLGSERLAARLSTGSAATVAASTAPALLVWAAV